MLKLRQLIDDRCKQYDEAIAKVKSDKAGALLLRDKKRFLCQNDLFYLAKLTGHTKMLDPFHRDLCELVSLMNWQLIAQGVMPQPENIFTPEQICDNLDELGKLQRLFLLFRSAFKTTIILKLHTIQLLLNFPDIHIALSHNTQLNSSDNLEAIKNIFLTTRLKTLFSDYIPNTKEWGNKTGFSVSKRKDFTMTGDNVEAIGIGTETVGRKYHVFKNDDIVTDKSVTNEEQLKQSRDYLELHKSLFVNPSIRIEDYSGTKYHFADAYAVLQEDPNVQKVIVPLLDKDGKCVVPEMFNAEGIKGLQADSYIWNCQYQLNPEDPKKIKFTKDMIQTFPHIPDGLNFYLVVDPADSEEKRACYTAMKIIGIDSAENWYWVDGLFDKLDDRERIDEAVRLAQKWKVFEVLWENISFGRTDNRNLERRRRELEDATWQVRPIPASRSSKEDRILGLNDRYSRHKVFWPARLMYYSKFEGKTIDLVEKQEYEFLGFPLVSHKDLLDAESFLLQIDTIKGEAIAPRIESKFAHIKDSKTRAVTQVFWHEWEKWKENGFAAPEDLYVEDYV